MSLTMVTLHFPAMLGPRALCSVDLFRCISYVIAGGSGMVRLSLCGAREVGENAVGMNGGIC